MNLFRNRDKNGAIFVVAILLFLILFIAFSVSIMVSIAHAEPANRNADVQITMQLTYYVGHPLTGERDVDTST